MRALNGKTNENLTIWIKLKKIHHCATLNRFVSSFLKLETYQSHPHPHTPSRTKLRASYIHKYQDRLRGAQDYVSERKRERERSVYFPHYMTLVKLCTVSDHALLYQKQLEARFQTWMNALWLWLSVFAGMASIQNCDS